GTGKSRLLSEAHRMAGEIEWVSVAGDAFARAAPYHAARPLLRRVLGIPLDATPQQAGALLETAVAARAPDLLPWLPLTAVVVDAVVDDTAEAADVAVRYRRRRTHQVVSDLLEAAADGP